MNTKPMNEGGENTGVSNAFTNACRECYQKVIAQIRAAKDAILAESRELLGVQEQILRLALNEAEALAWQTLYPHLVFPELATEKVRAIDGWSRHQRSIQRTAPVSTQAG
jgi:hypothetical protein